MRTFLSISCLFLLAAGCISVKPSRLTPLPGSVTRHPSPVTQYLPPSKSHLFKATLDIRDHHLTGLLIIKRMVADTLGKKQFSPGGKTEKTDTLYRIVFVNEVGMTFFDLELTPETLNVISCFASLNKKSLFRILETDLRMMMVHGALNNEKHYRQDSTGNLVKSGRSGKYSVWQTYSPAGDTLLSVSAKSNFADPVTISYKRYDDRTPSEILIENPFIGLRLTLRKLSGSDVVFFPKFVQNNKSLHL